MKIRYVAEFLGTFWLVFAGCGAAVISAAFPQLGIGLIGIALAFGLSAAMMAYAFAHLTDVHVNPAVTAGFVAAGRVSLVDGVRYVVAQLLGAIAASAILAYIVGGKPGFDLIGSGFAANGYDDHSPGGYSLGAGLVGELITTFFLLLAVIGASSRQSLKELAPLASGLALTVAYLVMLPVTNASLNPARSTGPALFVGGWAIRQLWLFWAGPLIGAIAAGYAWRWFSWLARSKSDGQPGGR
jgi:aquaporin Z